MMARAAATAGERAPGASSGMDTSQHDAFISYKHEDVEFAERLLSMLVARGKDVWMDAKGIESGELYKPDLKQAIEDSNAILFVISPQSAASSECRDEVVRASSLNKRIIPVHYRRTDPRQLPQAVADVQFAPARGLFDDEPQASLEQLITAMEKDFDWVREHTFWGQKARDWNERDRDDGLLLRGVVLEEAEQWLVRQSGKEPTPTALQNELVLESRRAAVRRLRRTRAYVSVALIVTIALALTALLLQQQAVSERHIATSGKLASESLLELGNDPQLSLLLADQSAQAQQTTAAIDALRRAVPRNRLLRTLSVAGDDRQLSSLAWSSDGSRVLTSSQDGTAKVWDSSSGQTLRTLPLPFFNHQGAMFDGSARHVLTWTDETRDGGDAVHVWDLYGSAAPVTIADPAFIHLRDAAISQVGGFVVTADGLEPRDQLWNAATGRRIARLGTHLDGEPVFSRQGDLVADSGLDGSVNVWSTATGALMAHFDALASIRSGARPGVSVRGFSPDGQHLLISAGPYTPQGDFQGLEQSAVWDIGRRQRVAVLGGVAAQWSPDGRYIVTTSRDGTAAVWDSAGKHATPLKGAQQIVGARFGPAATPGGPPQVLTGSTEGIAAVWNALTGAQIALLAGRPGFVALGGFSADGRRALTTTGVDGAARIWDVGTPPARQVPLPASLRAQSGALAPGPGLDADPAAPVRAISATGPQVALYDAGTGAEIGQASAPQQASYDNAAFDTVGDIALLMRTDLSGPGPLAAEVRRTHGGGLLHQLSGPGSAASAGAVSPDGKLVAAADVAQHVGVWDVASGKELQVFDGHVGHSTVWGQAKITLKFSPDSQLILTSDESGSSFVWRPRTKRILNRISSLAKPPGSGYRFTNSWGGAISPRDDFVAIVSSWDSLVHLYEVGRPLQLITATAPVYLQDAAFNADGSLLATVGSGTVSVFDTQHPDPVLTINDDNALSRIAFSSDGQSLITDGPFDARYDTLPCLVCGGFSRMLALAHHRELRKLDASEQKLYLG